MSTVIRRGYVDGRHGQIHYREAGVSGPRPLVLFHQNPSSSFEYEPLIRELAADRRVIALDTPGYGMSDAPPAPLSMADYASSLVDVLPALGVTAEAGCDVYGFHTGALLAVEAALARPDCIRRIAVTGLPMRDAADRAERLAAAQRVTEIDEAGEVPLTMARKLWDYVVADRTAGVDLHRAAANWIEKLRPLDRMSWAYVGVWSYDFETRLPLLGQPVLLLQPHEDIVAESIAAAALIPDHRIVELPEWRRDIFDIPAATGRMAEILRRFFDTPFLQE